MPRSLDNDAMACLRRTALAVQRTFGCSGTTITQNIGPPGQDVFHTHFHVIPRHLDDDNLSSPYQAIELATRIEQAGSIARSLAAMS
jgi:diadenosine tetraphosphate (Ap4A) HIT family hydrolase